MAYLYAHLPQKNLANAFKMMSVVLDQYEGKKIGLMEENELLDCIGQSADKISVECKELFKEELSSACSSHEDFKFDKMI